MRILAVDDDPIILEILTQFVEVMGDHDLQTAMSGMEAMEIVQSPGKRDFDCFLLDIQMPEMDGIELAKSIRELGRHADTPILMLTAMSDKRYVDAAFSAGATDYITKPFEVAELKARLGLVEGLVQARLKRSKKVFATKAMSAQTQNNTPVDTAQLHEPISVYDVENVIDCIALENYVAQLSRGSLFGSTTFAFAIRRIEQHYKSMSGFEFYSMIADVAEVISDTLAGQQFLMSYVGNGAFVCVTESGWRPDMKVLMDAVNLSLSRTDLFDNTGHQLHVRVSAGEAVRLAWKSENTVLDAVAAAHLSAEAATAAHERGLTDYWQVQQRA